MRIEESIRIVNHLRSMYTQRVLCSQRVQSIMKIKSDSKLEVIIDYIERRWHPPTETELFHLVCETFSTEDNLTQLKYFEAIRLFRSTF